jgi:hypothetical protein
MYYKQKAQSRRDERHTAKLNWEKDHIIKKLHVVILPKTKDLQVKGGLLGILERGIRNIIVVVNMIKKHQTHV